MSGKKLLYWILLFDLLAFSGYVMWEVGYLGIWQAGFASLGAMQILMDLVVACVLVSGWILVDARQQAINPWPWLIAILATGSIAILGYLLVRTYRKEKKPAALVSASA